MQDKDSPPTPPPLAARPKTLLPQLVAELKNRNHEDIQIIGGVIPDQDYDTLLKNGASAIFDPDTVIPKSTKSTKRILELLLEHLT